MMLGRRVGRCCSGTVPRMYGAFGGPLLPPAINFFEPGGGIGGGEGRPALHGAVRLSADAGLDGPRSTGSRGTPVCRGSSCSTTVPLRGEVSAILRGDPRHLST